MEVCNEGSYSSTCLEEVQLPDSVDVCTSLGFPGGKCITPYDGDMSYTFYTLHYYNPPQLEFGSMH